MRSHGQLFSLHRGEVDPNVHGPHLNNWLHPVSITRFPSFRTQPLENLSVDSVTNGFLSNPAPGEYLVSGNLVMETGCSHHGKLGHCAPCSSANSKNKLRSQGRGPGRWQGRGLSREVHTCHILPPSEIDLGLCFAVFAGSGGKYSFHRIGWKGRIWQLWSGKRS